MDRSEEGLATKAEEVDTEDVKVDDNVDQLFEEKMRKLRELGLYDDRMMDKVKLIKEMESNPNKTVPRSHLRRHYVPLGRQDFREVELEEFTGDVNQLGEGFKPIEGSSLKWSLPKWRKRPLSPSEGETSAAGDVKPSSSREQPADTSRRGFDIKPKVVTFDKFDKFFETRKNQKTTATVEKKEMITDIDAFIKNCNKKAEPPKPSKPKPKPGSLDEIDMYINMFSRKLKKIDKHFGIDD